MPGLAKTLAVQTLADALGGSCRRIQFTPDLLPSDVVGTAGLRPTHRRVVGARGPVFANFVVADEINRAPAKVQSALRSRPCRSGA
ncbi:MAG: AAA family ATPase [Planctomycetota bacterium]